MDNQHSQNQHNSTSKNQHIIFVGMPGAGKTTLGQAVAAHYGWPFVDLDAEIERRSGKTIVELFAAEHESGFRKREAETLRTVLRGQPAPLVLATGGGTPCFHHNMDYLNSRGFTVWLDAPNEVLIERLAASADTRPLLANPLSQAGVELPIMMLLSERSRYYQQARMRTAAQTPDALLAALAAGGFVAPPEPT